MSCKVCHLPLGGTRNRQFREKWNWEWWEKRRWAGWNLWEWCTWTGDRRPKGTGKIDRNKTGYIQYRGHTTSWKRYTGSRQFHLSCPLPMTTRGKKDKTVTGMFKYHTLKLGLMLSCHSIWDEIQICEKSKRWLSYTLTVMYKYCSWPGCPWWPLIRVSS